MKTIIQIQDEYILEVIKIDYSTYEGNQALDDLRRATTDRLVPLFYFDRRKAERAVKDADDMHVLYCLELAAYALHH